MFVHNSETFCDITLNALLTAWQVATDFGLLCADFGIIQGIALCAGGNVDQVARKSSPSRLRLLHDCIGGKSSVRRRS